MTSSEQKLAADAWIGGSDGAIEDEWRWIGGPENSTQFSNGSTPMPGQFANWNTGEPNNSGGDEDAAEIYSSGGGKWNDLPASNTLSGYVAEYGGMPGDPSPQITDTRDVSVSTLPTVTTTTVTSVTGTGAASGGNVTSDGGATVTARGVCWSTAADPTTADGKTTDGTGTGVFTSSITGLSSNTTYHVRAYATNSVGTSYGSDVEFTTNTTSPTITTTAVSNLISTGATSGGNVTDDGGDTVTARGVCWSTAADPTTADDKTTDGTGTGVFTSSITGLSSNTTYHVRAYATNSVGTSYGSDVEFTTNTTSPTITTTAVSNLTSTGATSGGNVTDDGGDTVTARGVCWSTAADPTTADDKTTDGTGTGVFTSSITGLSSNTTYHVRAYATNSVGTSYGSDVEFTTNTTSPTITTTAVSNLTSTGATSGGNVTDDGGDTVTARGVCWSTAADPTTADDKTTDGTGTGVFTSSITGLSSNTTYHVRAYATNSVGTSYGSDVEFTTNTTSPTITTTAVSNLTSTGATSGGNVTDDGGDTVTARGVCWSTAADPTTADDKTTDGTGTGVFTSSITGLSSNTTYHVRAYATNSVGTSYGSDVEFTTNTTSPTITTTAVSNLISTGATSGGNVTDDGGDTVTARGVCWSTAADPTTADDQTTDGTGTGVFTSNITGLFPDTTYYVAAYATSSAGTAYGDDVTFATLAEETTPESAAAPDLRVWIEVPAEDSYVGDEVTFGASVENVGDGAATGVLLTVPLPENTEFVSAWRVASLAAQAAPLNASVEADEISIEVGDVAAGEDVQIELVLKLLVAGKVTVYASTTCEETLAPSAAQNTAEVEVEDVEWIIIETITPIHACGVLGIMPVFVLLGLVGLKRRGRKRSGRAPAAVERGENAVW